MELRCHGWAAINEAMRKSASVALVLLGLCALPACKKKSEKAPTEPPPAAAPAEPKAGAVPESDIDTPPATRADVKAHMKDHFTQVIQVRDAVVDGNLEAVREPGSVGSQSTAPPRGFRGRGSRTSKSSRPAPRVCKTPRVFPK